jgi:uncharacterized surface protein with fasciclin (FAS1) repeats
LKNVLAVACLALALSACNSVPSTGDLTKAVETNAAAVEKDAAAEAKAAEAKAKEEADKAAAEAEAAAKAAIKVDVVDTAVAAGNFKTLATALQAAALIEALKGPGPFTVFAPTDEAFAKIPAATLTALLADKKKLTKVLQAHVVPGKVMAADVKTMKAKTLGGADIDVVVKDGKVTFGGANVTATDIDCTNGVIHVIDTVVMPK